MEYTTIADLIGLTPTKVFVGSYDAYDALFFEFEDGRTFMFYHSQDCCEHVEINDIVGVLDDLCGVPLLVAEEAIESSETGYGGETWTFYNFRTIKGSVTVRWHGSSNGYYSESVYYRWCTN